MKVTVTHAKAPWPAGAAIGSIVEVPGDAIPAWAVGKCTAAPADAEAQHVWEPPAVPEPVQAPVAVPAAPLAGADQQALDEVKRLLADAEAALAARTDELESVRADLQATQQKLADAEAAVATKARRAG